METENPSGAEAAGRGHGVFRWVLVVGLILVLYVLSVGPAAKLADKGVLGLAAFKTIYTPLQFLYDHWTPTRKVIHWYVGLWIGPVVVRSP